MGYSEWEFRKMDEEFCEAHAGALAAPALGGITWMTCLAPTTKGPCIKGVKYMVHGQRTGNELCEEHAAEREKLVDALTADVMGGLRVFVTRDGYALTEDQLRERANNICAALLGNYELRAL